MARAITVIVTVCLLGGTAFSEKPDPKGAEFFTKKIQPILAENCFKCHSHEATKIKGGLLLDSREAVLKGGDSGPAVAAGDPDKSLLIKAVSYTDPELQMPPKDKKLPNEQIALLSEWVKMGVPYAARAAKLQTPNSKLQKDWWSFQTVRQPPVPKVKDRGWAKNDIDRFIFQKLDTEGLSPSPEADRRALVRRVYFDLWGLPPTPEEVEAFVADKSPDAYEKLIDRLLASPRYGERWARHWLDLVRYAESDGFRIDDYRPNAWRYRDYVIRAFNEDKPYDRFVLEQLAGDELAPNDPDALLATGFLRLWIYEYNQRDVVLQWHDILNDMTDVTGDVFLGLGMGCARCHDHKFDPILQKDYFRLQAFFSPFLPRDDVAVATPQQRAEYQAKLAAWEAKTAEIRKQIEEIEKPHREKAAKGAIDKFPIETQALIRKPIAERAPYEHQIAELAYRQVHYEYDRLSGKIKGTDKEKIEALRKELAQFDKEKPAPLPAAPTVSDVGPTAPPTFIPKKKQEDVAPEFLSVLKEKPPAIRPLPSSTGRRAALARWLTRPDHPLTTRVIANRIWQYHFGRGLVTTSSDFGTLGEKPSHPELLDWLATRFAKDGWSFKKMHRLILTSAAYRQSATAVAPEVAVRKDPENRWLWRANTRRLDAEQIRDAILAVTGDLDPTAGGPAVDTSKPRRTIYTQVRRNTRDPLLDVFDVPDPIASVSQRDTTTTPTQALFLFNSQAALLRAKAFAARLQKSNATDDGELVATAYRLAYGRDPRPDERAAAVAFLQQQIKQFDPQKIASAGFIADRIPLREGKAAVLTPNTSQDRFTIPDNASLPSDEFTIEAFVVLRSLYEDASVRTIAAHWDGNPKHTGWSLGVTSKQSKYKPQTLVLQLTGKSQDEIVYEPIFSDLHIHLNKPYFVAVSVRVSDAGEKGVTFYTKDLSNDDEPMQVTQLKHTVTAGVRATAPFTIGGRVTNPNHLWDGLIDDVRLSNVALTQEQLLLTSDRVTANTVGYWQFEAAPNTFRDSSDRGNNIVPPPLRGEASLATASGRAAVLVDFCHVLLNSNEFLYVD